MYKVYKKKSRLNYFSSRSKNTENFRVSKWGQESRTCGARESHLWGKRVAPVGQESRTCGARESYLWGKRVAPVGQESRTYSFLKSKYSYI